MSLLIQGCNAFVRIILYRSVHLWFMFARSLEHDGIPVDLLAGWERPSVTDQLHASKSRALPAPIRSDN